MRLLFISSHPLQLVQPLQLLTALHCETVPYAAAAGARGLTISRREQYPSSHISFRRALLDSRAVRIQKQQPMFYQSQFKEREGNKC